MKPNWQEQTATPLFSLHKLFGPHGDGLQGCIGTVKKQTVMYTYSLYVLQSVYLFVLFLCIAQMDLLVALEGSYMLVYD